MNLSPNNLSIELMILAQAEPWRLGYTAILLVLSIGYFTWRFTTGLWFRGLRPLLFTLIALTLSSTVWLIIQPTGIISQLMGLGNGLLLFWGLSGLSLRGRSGNIATLYWLLDILFTFLTIVAVSHLLYLPTSPYGISKLLTITIFWYFLLRFIQLVCRRFHDLNYPAYYVLGFFPIISWIIGVRIFVSGRRLLGVLVFLNLTVGLLYLLIAKGTKGPNYYGPDPRKVQTFLNDLRKIQKAKSISASEQELLKTQLTETYLERENKDKLKFINSEAERLLSKEGISEANSNNLKEKRLNHYILRVTENLERKYLPLNRFFQQKPLLSSDASVETG